MGKVAKCSSNVFVSWDPTYDKSFGERTVVDDLLHIMIWVLLDTF